MVFVCKVGGCNISGRPQEVAHEVLLKSRSKSRFKWNQREGLMKDHIGSLNILDKCGCRVSCKGLEMLDYTSHVEDRRRFVV